ncbi:hypothetical protein CEXT_712321 [Caerostris extrusa]|uniref:Uncharacterized protein n=1 Tax=Caerostris extrusa TaxID=172846 RepID=A0AAV4VRB2_CAEEX|nr:hypothetical protein CEXT_712321 [Caerostris extrusa]
MHYGKREICGRKPIKKMWRLGIRTLFVEPNRKVFGYGFIAFTVQTQPPVQTQKLSVHHPYLYIEQRSFKWKHITTFLPDTRLAFRRSSGREIRALIDWRFAKCDLNIWRQFAWGCVCQATRARFLKYSLRLARRRRSTVPSAE